MEGEGGKEGLTRPIRGGRRSSTFGAHAGRQIRTTRAQPDLVVVDQPLGHAATTFRIPDWLIRSKLRANSLRYFFGRVGFLSLFKGSKLRI